MKKLLLIGLLGVVLVGTGSLMGCSNTTQDSNDSTVAEEEEEPSTMGEDGTDVTENHPVTKNDFDSIGLDTSDFDDLDATTREQKFAEKVFTTALYATLNIGDMSNTDAVDTAKQNVDKYFVYDAKIQVNNTINNTGNTTDVNNLSIDKLEIAKIKHWTYEYTVRDTNEHKLTDGFAFLYKIDLNMNGQICPFRNIINEEKQEYAEGFIGKDNNGEYKVFYLGKIQTKEN